ncbi:hypothetical protein A2862_01525 [Candidatus Roizmanbacteria bacterium RIFCSPHIGHO2_01_FULL_38_41]|uniref:Uncharacterized protein n=1 Tax=Candidatus Roizmanbacteria bacterium RIFCSPHIGHO2_02_FULL_37_24 TaxID=1802037 RepID=A0A1F7GVP2_9BACT|nr:MAG: hypothetical protein A2862_01525 [Candidatus Roizmanbacteria bacterium RIFCSPHIGHO2_01_FULL_38_41]OGK22885.1 MAG: hypothetical protein A3C24_03405 [Candidatus Roizmanbacteria bacterium RIFCSPHIGHO2_02_FULL_37_24]OGK32440.1 MAG: hypothetical protein A3E10_03910 [Candidatus Roizmanbacteria bacterium RIFCSPHIGHO2_12_FULL_37_23]OGK58796.1 MAG: hypothetical protein A3G65_00905 [Candidatus Roizmanbacteria bacterium RIFCSPLOWO2_12_FULL_37_7b]
MIDTEELPIDVIKEQLLAAQHGTANEPSEIEEALDVLANSLRIIALEYARSHSTQQWLIDSLQAMRHLDGIVADMRHIEGGQDFILSKLEELKPDLCWYRGGTLLRWGDNIGPASTPHFTSDQLNTYVIDGGANGTLGRPDLALSFLKLTPRRNPALYTLTIADLRYGLRTNAIRIGTEHYYDLCINEGDDRLGYLGFCRNNLKIQPISLPEG